MQLQDFSRAVFLQKKNIANKLSPKNMDSSKEIILFANNRYDKILFLEKFRIFDNTDLGYPFDWFNLVVVGS